MKYVIRNQKPKSYSKKVPFVEISPDGTKLQGIVSSGSSGDRVYVCVINKSNHTYTCHTNNNRRCGGLRGNACSHLKKMLAHGTKQLGSEVNGFNLHQGMPDGKARYGEVFARFLNYLRYLFIEFKPEIIPEFLAFDLEVTK